MWKNPQPSTHSGASESGMSKSNPTRASSVAILGPSIVIKGSLAGEEDLVIEGTIEGVIAHHKKNLTIGKQGRVTADIRASSVLVEGELKGDIHSDGLVSLAKSAKVIGDIYCNSLVTEDGAQFNGKIEMAIPTPLKVAPEPEEVDEEFMEAENLTA